ncbi:MAG: cell surface protein SprA [Saprospiraceae bacterium]|nr:cell surface protein SprA [Saprospiraceae bacterium]
MKRFSLFLGIVVSVFSGIFAMWSMNPNLKVFDNTINSTVFNKDLQNNKENDPDITTAKDTIPPLHERYDDFLNHQSENPFDLQDPNTIEKNVEFDPISGKYILTERIGNDYYRMPTYMTFDEYLEYNSKKQERDYFNRLNGISKSKDASVISDPVKKIDIQKNMLDRLFGGSDVEIKPQGNIDLTFGLDYQNVLNPVLPERARKQGPFFDFDMNIRMNVVGKIGEKLNLSTNYNTQQTFDFENQLKIQYNSDKFSEDEIFKKIEAGHVSLPLRGSLIQGAQSLFGVKTDLQFGRLRLSILAAQQKSRRQELTLQGGSQIQQFSVPADQYDENRHFFVSHYHRNTFERSLANLPNINSLFNIQDEEVWVLDRTNNNILNNQNAQGTIPQIADIIALTDLGEYDRMVNTNPLYQPNPADQVYDIYGKPLPTNSTNKLLTEILNPADTAYTLNKDQVVNYLETKFGLVQGRDFVRVRARKLRKDEYFIHRKLGFISLNAQLQPDQVVGISYRYAYNGNDSLKIGQVTTENNAGNRVVYVKMLKGSTQRTDVPMWDLMMKNIYSIGAYQADPKDFRLDIFYEEPGKGEKRFLSESNLADIPLINVFNLDNLNTLNDPQPDGLFDFVPELTINPKNGRIMFPVLEPFGKSLSVKLNSEEFRAKFVYDSLYTTTITRAREFSEFNRFTIKGTFKSSVSTEISLGSFNIPQGSVQVYAGGILLQEGIDYEIDYSVGRVKILNDSYLASGTPVRVSFEDNSLYTVQQKTLVGTRADYQISKNFNIGATYMHLFERPYTQKVNLGEDPINNRIYGFDLNYSSELPWLTKAIDRLPLLETKEPSKISVSGEGAVLKPSHSRAINLGGDKNGAVYLDDFEGSSLGVPLGFPFNRWILSSIPRDFDRFSEAKYNDSLISGVNRGLLNWYRFEQALVSNTTTNGDPYSAAIPIQEVFKNQQLSQGENNILQTFDIAFYPDERGPYNFDLPNGTAYSAGINPNGGLNAPETRWAGIMRDFQQVDFEAANYEFIEFWMLSPYLLDPNNGGDMYINIGNVSEDVLGDSRQFFENGLPDPGKPEGNKVTYTKWARTPSDVPITNSFAIEDSIRKAQDVGLDGLSDAGERDFYSNYITTIENTPGYQIYYDSLLKDPSNDNFVHYRNASVSNLGLVERYKRYNNPESNSGPSEGDNLNSSSNNPDAEDINRDNNFNLEESYYEYHIPLESDGAGGVRNSRFITDVVNGSDGRIWYRFKIPIIDPDRKVGNIQDLRSIRFLRMYLKNFEKPVVLRLANFELARNQWRRYRRVIKDNTSGPVIDFSDEGILDVNRVNIEQNSGRTPFNYVLPLGVQREQNVASAFANIYQNEQSLSIKTCNLNDGFGKAVFKNTLLDLRVYDDLRMFVHAESAKQIPEGDVSLFMRIGSDYENNYYEYEVPLKLSDINNLPATSLLDSAYTREVWRVENELNFPLSLLTDVKTQRNNSNIPLDQLYAVNYTQTNNGGNYARKVAVKGNPNLGLIKGIMIGLKANSPVLEGSESNCIEVWVNELRVNGFDERGGWATTARMDVNLADFGRVAASSNYSSIGWGAIDKKIAQRAREKALQYDVATNLELGKLLPETSGIKIPFYAQYTSTIKTPEFDPYDLDLKLKDKLNSQTDGAKRDSIRQLAQDFTSIKSINVTDVRKERSDRSEKAMPWDVENFSATYAYSETVRHTPIIENDQSNNYKGALAYNYSRPSKYITPFKKLIKNDKNLKLISDFNFNLLPSTVSVNNILERRIQKTKYRFTGENPLYSTYYIRRFTWDRSYNLNWDITKSIKFNFIANNTSVIDELDNLGRTPYGENYGIDKSKDYLWANIKNFGRTKTYTHNFDVTYNVPFKNIPYMDWVSVKAQYKGSYAWNAASINIDSLGNVIQNTQSRQINGDLNFEKLYNSFKYLKKINQGYSSADAKSSSEDKNKKDAKSGKDKKGLQAAKPNSADDVNTLDTKGSDKDTKADDKDKKDKNSKEPIALVPPSANADSLSSNAANAATADKSADKNDNKDKKKTKADKEKKERQITLAEYILIRPLMILRKAKLNYTEDFATTIPGFMQKTSILGMNPDFSAPGWDFVAGWQPDQNWYNRATTQNQDWITPAVTFNQQSLGSHSQDIDGRVTLEPFKDFRVEVNANRKKTTNHTELFKRYDDQYDRREKRDIGSFTVTYFALNTLFEKDYEKLFNDFESNRQIISERLGSGNHAVDTLYGHYTQGYGRTQQDVLIPAFISAYTGSDAATVPLASQLFNTLPRLNWKLTYNGLQRLGFFKDVLKTFNLNHGYQSTMTVNSFLSSNNYDENNPFKTDLLSANYYSQFEIPTIVINEQFNPLIGLDLTTINNINFKVDYKRDRNLGMNFIDNGGRLTETKGQSFTLGFGYKIKNVYISFLDVDKWLGKDMKSKNNKKTKSKKKKSIFSTQDTPTDPNAPAGKDSGAAQKGNDLDFKVDISFRDDVSLIHQLDKDNVEPTRGTRSLQISPAVEYMLNKKMTMRLFFDYRRTEPKTSQSFPITNINSGVMIRFNL